MSHLTMDYLDALRRDGDALISAAAHSPDAPVPSCPGWTTTDLLVHVCRIYRYVAVQARSDEPVDRDTAEIAGDDVPALTADALAELLVVLAEIDPAAPSWNWARSAEATAAFWPRRMAMETAIHRWDAQLAVGTPGPFDPALACDGVDEALSVFLPARRGRTKEDVTGTAHLHATDAPPEARSEWTIAFEPQGAMTIRHVHEKADAALRGPAGVLFLAVWGRTADGIERFGDETVAAAVRAQ
jgi:uncharacterized protein (TIGR03083 family)